MICIVNIAWIEKLFIIPSMSKELFFSHSSGLEPLSKRKTEISGFIKNFEDDILRGKPETLPLEDIFVETLDYAIDYGDPVKNVLTGFSKEKIEFIGERVSGYFRKNFIIRSRFDDESKKYTIDRQTQKIVASLCFGLQDGKYYYPGFLDEATELGASKAKTVKSVDLWQDTYRILQDTDLAEQLRGPNMPIDDWKEKNDLVRVRKTDVKMENVFSLEEIIMNGEYKEVENLAEWDGEKIDKILDYISDFPREDWDYLVPPDIYYSMRFAANRLAQGALPDIRYEELNQEKIFGTLSTVGDILSHLQGRIEDLRSKGRSMDDIKSLKDLYGLASQLKEQAAD